MNKHTNKYLVDSIKKNSYFEKMVKITKMETIKFWVRDFLSKQTFGRSSRRHRRGVVIESEDTPHMHQELAPGREDVNEFCVIVSNCNSPGRSGVPDFLPCDLVNFDFSIL